MFYQDPKESLQRAHQRPVDHDGLMLYAIFPNIGQRESLREVKVNLDRGTLPRTVQHILDLDVYLWSIEYPFTRVNLIGKPLHLKGLAQGCGGLFPVFHTPHELLRPCGEVDIVSVKPKGLQDIHCKIEDGGDLFLQLVRPAEYMCIILGEAPDPQEAV